MSAEHHILPPAADVPNSALPLVVVRDAVPDPAADATHALLRTHGWQGTWTYTVYDFWHFHVTGHEVLICVAGSADIGFGGDDGIVLAMVPGVGVVVPAGVGHKRLSGTSDFAVVGGYPPGQSGAITRPGEIDMAEAVKAIETLRLPERDPFTGERPGCLAVWAA
ncbi:hypothetical protein [Mangrovibrevibacter kandeliae]|uniref:hypothetical protein n=1 Tax=Mangrovibrevibacter kandeliae TaxID=2968473 RepID=UPI0021177B1A|nr:hypothetical protein [Aurantimonas sp. CSK15Z-1]MCQ8781519.1 hypothetical protein [Aurantimonas sp. CSK15Z-1]